MYSAQNWPASAGSHCHNSMLFRTNSTKIPENTCLILPYQEALLSSTSKTCSSWKLFSGLSKRIRDSKTICEPTCLPFFRLSSFPKVLFLQEKGALPVLSVSLKRE